MPTREAVQRIMRRKMPATIRVEDGSSWLTHDEWDSREHTADSQGWKVMFANERRVLVQTQCKCGDRSCIWEFAGYVGGNLNYGWMNLQPNWDARQRDLTDPGVSVQGYRYGCPS